MRPFSRLLLAIAAIIGLAAPVAAETAPDKAAIEAIVRDYLLANPEVIEEALTALQAKRVAAEAERRRQALDESKELLTQSPDDAVIGNPEGDVTLVEFFDYNCGFCKRALPDLLALIEKDKNLRVVLKDFPVLGPGSVEAATVAMAVKRQLKGDRFLAFHRDLLSTQGPVGKDRALEAAEAAGVDMQALDAAIKDQSLRKALIDTLKLGDSLGIDGTPTYVIGGELVVGAVGAAALGEKVASVRSCGQATC